MTEPVGQSPTETPNPNVGPPVLRTTAGTRIVDQWPYLSGDGDKIDRWTVSRMVEAVEHEAVALAAIVRPPGEPVGQSPACTRDLACYRNDGHDGDHAYPTPDTEPQPVRPPGDEAGLRAAASECRDAWAAFDEAVMAVPLLGDEFDRNSPEYLALKAAVSRRLEADDALRAALAAEPDREEPGLDVERLARAIFLVSLGPTPVNDYDAYAKAIAAEYARLANPDTGS